MDELLPCPFCGNAKNIAMVNEKHDHSGGYFIACPECGASTIMRYAMGDDPKPLLIESWNRRAVVAAQPEAGEAVAWRELLSEIVESCEGYERRSGKKVNGDWVARARAMLASAPTIQPTQPVQEAVPAKWRELLTEIADSCAGYEVRVGKKVNGDWLARARELLSATPPAQAGDAGEPSDGERLDFLQGTGSTVELLPPFKNGFGNFRIGGLHKAVSSDIRAAIDAAIRATKGGKL